jgi:hypothetical protein
MYQSYCRKFVYALLIALLPQAAAADSGAFKKWVDADGVTHYGTSIPPEYVDKEHSELNDRGIEVKHVNRARTPEEIAREKELERLRKAQKQAIADQRAKDRILLNMFRSEDDLVMMRDGKLDQVEAQLKLKKSYVERLKKRLTKWQAAAAAREREGKKPTAKQLENLKTIQQQLENSYSNIVEKEASKRRITNQFAYELNRFRQLKSGFRASSADDIEAPRETPTVIPVAGAFVCQDNAQCDRLWGYAKTWAEKNSGTPIEVIGERILVTKAPTKPDEISLTVSRLSREGVERLFLDINCHRSVRGKELCATDGVQALRDRFVHAMEAVGENRGAALPDE